MYNNIAAPGQGLRVPQSLYPFPLNNGAPFAEGQAEISLAPGLAIPVPAGTWIISTGKYCMIQYLDPVTQTWRGLSSARSKMQWVQSDGFNVRVANLTGCPVAAVVTNPGSNYVQATTTVVPTTGNSTWQPIVGGALASISVITTGSGYGMAPEVFIPAPPAPGVQATAVATISGGTVSGITLTNQGAGYTTIPSITILPNPADPNLLAGSSITNATGLTAISDSAGKITAILCTNPGVAISAAPTLTVAGAGSSGAATAVWMSTITAASVTVAGSGYSTNSYVTTVGGVTAATPTWTNPSVELNTYTPRQAQIGLAGNGTTLTSVGTIYDGGLFTGTPSVLVLNSGITTTVATVTITQGGANDLILMQQI